MYSEDQYQRDLLDNPYFFTKMESEEAKKILDTNELSTYSVLNQDANPYSVTVYRLRKGKSLRLFVLKTKQGNLYPVALLEAKGGQHDPKEYWKLLEPKVQKFVEWVALHGEPQRTPPMAKRPVSSSELSPKPTKKPESPSRRSTPLQKVQYWCGCIQKATGYDEQKEALLALASEVGKQGNIVLDGGNLSYQVKSGSPKHPLSIKLKDKDAVLEDLNRLSQSEPSVLKLMVPLVIEDEKAREKYLGDLCKQHMSYCEHYLHHEMLLRYQASLNEQWDTLTHDTKRKVIKASKVYPELFGIWVNPRRAQYALEDEKLMRILLSGDSICPWEVYVELVMHWKGMHKHLHMEYLEKHLEDIRKTPSVIKPLQEALGPVSTLLSDALRGELCLETAIVPVYKKKANQKYGDLAYRQKNHRNFSMAAWVLAFESGMPAQEMLTYINQYPYPAQPEHLEPSFLTLLKDHGPKGYNPYTQIQHRHYGLLGECLTREYARGMDYGQLKRFISCLYHQGLLEEEVVKASLGAFMCSVPSQECFDTMLRLLPRPDLLTSCRQSMLMYLINLSSCMIGPKYQFGEGLAYKQSMKKTLNQAAQVLPANNEIESFKLIGVRSQHLKGNVLVQFGQSYLQAIECSEFKIAETLIKRVSKEGLEKASVWIEGVRVCELNIRELMTFIPEYYTIQSMGEYDKAVYQEVSEILTEKLKGGYCYNNHQHHFLLREEAGFGITHQEMNAVMDGLIKDWDKAAALELNKNPLSHKFERIYQKVQMVTTFKANIESLRQNTKKDRTSLLDYLKRIGVEKSERKLALLDNMLSGNKHPILESFSDIQYEPDCIAMVSEMMADNQNVFLKLPKGYLDALDLTQDQRKSLSTIKLWSVLELAILRGFKNVVDMLVYEYNVPLDARQDGSSPVHMAAWMGNMALAVELFERSISNQKLPMPKIIERAKQLPDCLKESEVFKTFYRQLLSTGLRLGYHD